MGLWNGFYNDYTEKNMTDVMLFEKKFLFVF